MVHLCHSSGGKEAEFSYIRFVMYLLVTPHNASKNLQCIKKKRQINAKIALTLLHSVSYLIVLYCAI